MASKVPLAGRIKERAELRRLLNEEPDAVVVVRGPGGVGKSRLVEETTASLSVPVHWVGASEAAEPIPLGAFAPWIDSDITDALDRLIALTESLSGAEQQVVVIDDANHLDAQSLFVLERLMVTAGVAVVMTLRRESAVPPALIEIVNRRGATILDLDPLSRTETDELARIMLGAPMREDFSHKLWSITEGNPLFVISIIDDVRRNGLIVLEDESWTAENLRPPRTLAEAVRGRIRRASEDIVDIIDLLALAEPLPLELLRRLTTSAALEVAEAHQFIVVTPDGDTHPTRLAHPLFGEVSREIAGAARLRNLRSRLASELNSLPATTHRLRIMKAMLVSDAADGAPDRGAILVDGAQAALSIMDLPLALDISGRALNSPAQVDAYTTYGYALSLVGQGAAAERALIQGFAALGPHTTGTKADTIIMIRAANLLWTLGDDTAAKALVEHAGASVAIRDTVRGLCAAFAGDTGAALPVLNSVDRDRLPDIGQVLHSWAVVLAATERGEVSAAHTASASGYHIAASFESAAHQRTPLAYFDTYSSILAGNCHLLDDYRETLAQSLATAPDFTAGWLGGIKGMIEAGSGDARAAILDLRNAVTTLDAVGAGTFMWYQFVVEQGYAAALSGDVATLQSCLERLQQHPHPAFGFLDPRIVSLRAWGAALGGEISTAVALTHDAADLACARGQSGHEVYALQTALRFGDSTQHDRIVRLSKKYPALPRAAAAAEHSGALAARDAAGLLCAADVYHAIGLHDSAVDTLAQAAGLFGTQGRAGSRLTALERMNATAVPRGLYPPASVAAASADRLTERQREIVSMVRRGLTNREIAQRMNVSVRTIEGHLYRASQRTGTHFRDLDRPPAPTTDR